MSAAVPCRSCGTKRELSDMLRVTCLQHDAGDRDCVASRDYFICRPSVPGQRPDCLRYARNSEGQAKGTAVMGADLMRLELAVAP